MRESFVPISYPGYTAVDFNVTGTVDRPKTDLMGKLVGPQLKDLGGIIYDLLGGGKSSDRPKKKRPAEAAAPSPPEPPVEATQESSPPPSEPPAETPQADATP